MFSKIAITLAGVVSISLSLAACDEIRQATHEADALARGQETLAACIATQCDVLNIDGMRLEDYSVINDLSHVTVLMASRTNFADLNDISGMQHLKELHITRSDITDLTGLGNFPQLRVLHAEYMSSELDFSSIEQLAGLTELALGNLGEDDDVSFIRNMKKLTNLKITWTGVEADIEVLRGHPALQLIEISGDLPADQSALLRMPNLKSITFFDHGTIDADINSELDRRGVLSYAVMVVC